MQYEVENKYWIEDAAAARQKLAEQDAVWGETDRQSDEYFRHPSRDFAQTDEALRIRRVGDQNFVTYKGPKLDTKTKTRKELELPIEPGETGAKRFAELLAALGFESRAFVGKERRHFELQWQGRTVTGAWDKVAELGEFVELELIADEGELDVARGAIESLAERLALGRHERRSYLEMVLKARGME